MEQVTAQLFARHSTMAHSHFPLLALWLAVDCGDSCEKSLAVRMRLYHHRAASEEAIGAELCARPLALTHVRHVACAVRRTTMEKRCFWSSIWLGMQYCIGENVEESKHQV